MFEQRWRLLPLATIMLTACILSSHQSIAQSAAETAGTDFPFSSEWLRAYAHEQSKQPFSPGELDADDPLRSLDYDDYRRIVFNPDAAIWRNEGRPFQLQLFHPGFLHTTPVKIHLVSGATMRELPFATDMFQYHGGLDPIDPDQVGGYAGFRIHYPINTPSRHEEFLVFLGASYFRAVGKDQFYGLSARGLAVNTVEAGNEEFPRFSEFWIETPAHDDQQIMVHALLDSPSLTGAYQFRVTPGDPTQLEVDATLYPRLPIQHVGIAPLTSMFLFDATNRNQFDDFRSAVHDSDGLQIQQTNGETVWRPLTNPSHLQVSGFGSDTPAGFGLLQRHQDFAHFDDDEARYDKRTSLWIEPLDDWGSGQVVLMEIPSDKEIYDNIVAYWQPDADLEPGKSYRFRYRMAWGNGSPSAEDQGRILETAVGAANGGEERLFVIDYSDGVQIQDVRSNPGAVTINASTSAGTITDVSGTLLEANGNYRAYVKLDPGDADLAELRVTLEVADNPWGETWLYRWTR